MLWGTTSTCRTLGIHLTLSPVTGIIEQTRINYEDSCMFARLRLIILTLAIISLSGSLFGQAERAGDSSTNQQGMKILHEIAAALGSPEQIAAIKSLTKLIRVQMINPETADTAVLIDSVLQIFPFHELRISMTEDREKPRRYVLAGDVGWNAQDSTITHMHEIAVRNARRALEKNIVNVLQAIDEPYYEITYVGEDSLLGNTYTRIDFNTDSNYKFSWYVEPMTNQLKAHTTTLIPAQGFFLIEGYHSVGGVLLPKKESFRRQNYRVNITYEQEIVNAAYDSTVFQQP